MGKTHKLKINSIDYVEKKNEARDNFKKENIKSFLKINWKILAVFFGFMTLFILGTTLTLVGMLNKTPPTDLGDISSFASIASVGIIFILISLLSFILITPIAYRFTKKKLEKRKSRKIVKNS